MERSVTVLLPVHNVQSTLAATVLEILDVVSELTERFGRAVYFVAPTVNVELSEGSTADVLFRRSRRTKFDGMSADHESFDAQLPAVVRSRVGKGTVFYLAADIAGGYVKHRLPQVADVVAHLLRSVALPPIEVDAHTWAVQVTALQPDEKRIFVHLINTTAERFGRTAPLADISVRLNQGTIRRALAAIEGRPLTVTDNGVIVPRVNHGEVVVLELE